MSVFQSRERAQLVKLMVKSETQTALSTSATSKGPNHATKTSDASGNQENSVWDEVFDDNETSQDELSCKII